VETLGSSVVDSFSVAESSGAALTRAQRRRLESAVLAAASSGC
jgi:UTP:GlnB (protein PII) uridylyltransferase